jgi:DNA invertase Pin-like site-specific DNA recombinase
VRAALYARVSTEAQADRGTIGSQLQLLRAHIAAAGDELVGEYVDDGYSGARLDRPGLDALRDAAEAGLVVRASARPAAFATLSPPTEAASTYQRTFDVS